jgi:UDP-N-acetylmuramate--alanine ligase
MKQKLKLSNFHYKRIHFIGIGGSGMIALAQYLRAYGKCKISGSDITYKPALKELELQGVKIYKNHSKENISQCNLIVYSTAINDQNEELIEAKRKKLICLHRSEFLNLILTPYERKITVSGTHGKTTTTGMLIHILDYSGVNPSFMIGGEIAPYNINGRYAESTTFIAESDESDGSFLNLSPNYCIINNIEEEHLNYYKTKENLLSSFKQIIEKVLKNNGIIIANADDKNSNSIINNIKETNITTFSLKDTSREVYTKNISYNKTSTSFNLYHNNKLIDKITLNTLGTHNIYNALACITLCLKLGISINVIKKGLLNFKGVKRRLQLISDLNNIKIYDDYAHHPTAIKTTLTGLKKAFNTHITCIFQPHRYSRTEALLTSFFSAFTDADTVIITPIYSANETETKENNELLNKLITGIKKKRNQSKSIYNFKSDEDTIEFLTKNTKKGDIVITMGAGNISELSTELKHVFSNGGIQNKKTMQLSN